MIALLSDFDYNSGMEDYSERTVREERYGSPAGPVDPVAPVQPVEPVAPVAAARRGGYAYSETTRVAVYNPIPERVTWFIASLFVGMLLIRFTLRMLGASPGADFVRFIYSVTQPLVQPFRGIFNTAGSGAYVFEPESLVAALVYLLIGWAIVALLRIALTPRAPRRELY